MPSVASKLLKFYSSESKWTQLAFARDINKNPVGVFNSSATCWCLAGALEKLMQYDEISTNEYLDFKLTFKQSLEKFNDSHTFEELIKELHDNT